MDPLPDFSQNVLPAFVKSIDELDQKVAFWFV
jgi:hypothetical protein